MLQNGSKNRYFQGKTVACTFFILTLTALSSAISFAAQERKLSFYNTHTRERLPGTDTAVLRDKALAMKRGGVGYYKKSDFIQIDTGHVRRW